MVNFKKKKKFKRLGKDPFEIVVKDFKEGKVIRLLPPYIKELSFKESNKED